jgi:hypothetical protein
MPRQLREFIFRPIGVGLGGQGVETPVRICKNLATDICGIKVRLG